MSAPERSTILGWGACVPETVVTNDDLAGLMDTSDEWIQKRSGIKERRYVDNDDGSVGLAETASRDALNRAGLSPADIDLIVCGSLSPDIDFPGNSALLQRRLAISGPMAFDVRNQCSAFLYLMAIADQYVRTGGASNVLVVGSEVHSTGIEYADRSRHVTVLFGDGAGAVVIGASPDSDTGFLASDLHSDGRYVGALCVDGPGSRRKPRVPDGWTDTDIYTYPQMDGSTVFKHAVRGMTASVETVTASAGFSKDDIDMLLPHQANLRINQLVAMGLGIDDARMANNIDRYGNTTAATIPILLAETLEEGRIKKGDLLCFTAFGAGFTWGSALLRW